MVLATAFTLALSLGTVARAADDAPPSVDLTTVPATADVQSVGSDGKPHPVRARLLLEEGAVAAGSTAHVGLLLEQQKGWHTYWRTPGEIGLPTDIVWTLPPGVTAGPLQFPVPHRFEAEGIVSFGYEDQVLLLSDLAIPADLAPGTQEITAEASWLVCQSSCIPGSAKLVLPITVTAAGTPATPAPWAPLFAHYRAHMPASEADAGLTHEVALSQSAIQANKKFDAVFFVKAKEGAVALPALAGKGTWPVFTPILGPNTMLSGDHPVEMQAVDGGVRVAVHAEAMFADPQPATEPIGGLFQLDVGGKTVRTEIVEPLPFVAETAPVTPGTSPLLKAPAAAPATASVAVPQVPVAPPADQGLLGNLLLAFVGGLILNVMPCVLPVLTLKLYSLVEQSEITPRERHLSALAYSGGIVASFLGLAAALLAARSVLGIEVGWGTQFQYPGYVAALCTLVFSFGLSLFGVFEIPAFGAATAHDASSKEGIVGYFFTGVFATLLATPCSAPFLGTAVGFAFAAPPVVLFAIFTSVALGLAAPFLLIAFVPAFYRLMPKPGEWMDWFKQLLGFSLMGTAIWLVHVLNAQIGYARGTWFLVFLLCVGISCWIYGRWGGVLSDRTQHATALAVALGVSCGAFFWFVDLEQLADASCEAEVTTAGLDFADDIPWQPFSASAVDSLAGKPVFVDFTAEWCFTCKVNERTVLDTDVVRTAMRDGGVVPLKADWTRRDPAITEWLGRYGKAGVPFYLVIPADRTRDPIPLSEVITQNDVTEALTKAR